MYESGLECCGGWVVLVCAWLDVVGMFLGSLGVMFVQDLGVVVVVCVDLGDTLSLFGLTWGRCMWDWG